MSVPQGSPKENIVGCHLTKSSSQEQQAAVDQLSSPVCFLADEGVDGVLPPL
jgi:hypothetical protein